MTFRNPLLAIQRKRAKEKKEVKEAFVKSGQFKGMEKALHEKMKPKIDPSELPF